MDFRAQIRKLTQRLTSTVVRGVVTRINDTLATQTVQVELRFDDIAGDVEHFQPFGLSFHPTVDSECVVLAVGSSQDNLVAVAATDRANRPTGASEGEGGLYTPSGWKVFLASDDVVHLSEKSASDFVALAADVKRELDAIKQSLDTHVHSVSVTGSAAAQSGSTTAVTSQSYTPQPVAASKVKAT